MPTAEECLRGRVALGDHFELDRYLKDEANEGNREALAIGMLDIHSVRELVSEPTSGAMERNARKLSTSANFSGRSGSDQPADVGEQ